MRGCKDAASTAVDCATSLPSGIGGGVDGCCTRTGWRGLGVLIGDDAARTLADRIGVPS
jgi:hypothetical protein